MLSPRRPEPVLCFCCRKVINGEAYQHGGLSYCGEHWLSRQNATIARITIKNCWQLPAKERK